ncbi:MAG: DUF362 domain-containing protein [Candidatus Omnitrophota bacterium]|jgi:hypothetical protein
MMKSKVYFTSARLSDGIAGIQQKLDRLLAQSRILDIVQENDTVAIKMHFGEVGNTGYVLPEYMRVICERIARMKATPILSDTNTLYQGKRTNSKDHLQLAYEHGFRPEVVLAQVEIPDDTNQENCIEIPIDKKFIKTAKIAKFYYDAEALVDVAHFKGHIMTGFGGVLKNIGMGCATREGKLAQHSDVSPFVKAKQCVGCKECLLVCPVKAIEMKSNVAVIDGALCIGCASCIAACKKYAIEVNWESGGSKIQEKMVEYALAVLKNKKEKAAFINFAMKITKECDCLAKDDPRIAPDIGICASSDPVSIDKACMDLINKASGKDVFKASHPNRDGTKQLTYAAQLGLGNLEYELITVGEGQEF